MLCRPDLSFCRRLCRILGQQQQYHADASQPGILSEYNRLVSEGRIQADPTQLAAVQALQLLQEGLVLRLQARALSQQQHEQQQHEQQEPPAQQDRPKDATDGSSSSSSSRPQVQGAYLWGPVGSGKTFLMDLFLNTLPAAVPPAPPQTPPGFPASSNTAEAATAPSSSSSSGDSAAAGDGGVSEALLVRVDAERLHFHTFMLGVHQQLHELQQALPKVVGRSRAGLPVFRHALPPEDPILVVARSAAASTDLLCLDELHVTDIADAMLLSRLFGEVLRCGCSVLVTSNRPPRDLYKGGLSRRYFEPFIRLVDDRLLQLRVAGGLDYRTTLKQQQQQTGLTAAQDQPTATAAGVWLVGPHSSTQLQQQWQQLAQQPAHSSSSNAAPGQAQVADGPTTIPLPFGRSLWVPRAILHPSSASLPPQHIAHPHPQQQQQHLLGAYFTFEQLCGNSGSRPSLAAAGALSANDYLALVQTCGSLYVEGLTQLQPNQRDEARRLVTLVDLLYEAHSLASGSIQLCVAADVPPHQLFLPLLGAAARQGVNPNLGRAGDKLDVKALIKDAHSRQAAQQPPHHLLGSAVAGEDAAVGVRQGQTPAAGLSRQAGAPAAAASAAASDTQRVSGGGSAEVGQGKGEAATTAAAAAGAAPPPALLAEEVLMYHRATSRLAELCAVNTAGSAASVVAC